MPLQPEPLYTVQAIQQRVQELAGEITAEYFDAPPLCLITLKGAMHFGSDLLRAMDLPVEIDFIRAQSYSDTQSTGMVELLYTPTSTLQGRAVLLIEDIIDTGRTALALREWLQEQGTAECRIVTLLDKSARREVDIQADFIGFSIEDHFVVGFGMDYNEQYRELPDIRIWET
ncbi:MAG: hypoxanthine phosphoribosyltransferase [Candidatus Hydrogenedentota bacterium]|nr:MAG: hypoxanthine phosphoribosyltransferase [Candidatus Hydrogenedentota bacterium]